MIYLRISNSDTRHFSKIPLKHITIYVLSDINYINLMEIWKWIVKLIEVERLLLHIEPCTLVVFLLMQ